MIFSKSKATIKDVFSIGVHDSFDAPTDGLGVRIGVYSNAGCLHLILTLFMLLSTLKEIKIYISINCRTMKYIKHSVATNSKYIARFK